MEKLPLSAKNKANSTKNPESTETIKTNAVFATDKCTKCESIDLVSFDCCLTLIFLRKKWISFFFFFFLQFEYDTKSNVIFFLKLGFYLTHQNCKKGRIKNLLNYSYLILNLQ